MVMHPSGNNCATAEPVLHATAWKDQQDRLSNGRSLVSVQQQQFLTEAQRLGSDGNRLFRHKFLRADVAVHLHYRAMAVTFGLVLHIVATAVDLSPKSALS